jgi:hypothetical protein
VDMELYEEGEGERGIARAYVDVLRLYEAGIRGVLEQVRDGRGEEAVLFHCNGEFVLGSLSLAVWGGLGCGVWTERVSDRLTDWWWWWW